MKTHAATFAFLLLLTAASSATTPPTQPAPEALAKLPIYYAQDSLGTLIIGNFDRQDPEATFYQWRGVPVGSEEGLYVEFVGRIVPINLKQLGSKIEVIDPPIQYIALDQETVAPGFAVKNHATFYRFRDEKIARKDLPKNAVIHGETKDRFNQWQLEKWQIIEIARPTPTTISLPPSSKTTKEKP